MTDLPDEIDPELWFECNQHPGTRDYLVNTAWQTFPGRMSAWCEVDRVGFRVSKPELPDDLPVATRYWVQGFLTGNLPRQPPDDSPSMDAWQAMADRFLATGYWPPVISTEQQQQWSEEAQLLAEVGREFAGIPLPVIEVRIPKDLADLAEAAWSREDEDNESLLQDETAEQRTDRRQAGVLALIGLAIGRRGKRHDDAVAVQLSASLVVAAIEAARA